METCSRCGNQSNLYGRYFSTDSVVCYPCCAEVDKEEMCKSGNSRKIPLYVVFERRDGSSNYAVTNFPGSLRFECKYTKTSKHNIGKVRTDVWFDGPDGHVWHGVHYGWNSSIVHCNRTKELSK